MNMTAFTFWLPGPPEHGRFMTWRRVAIPFGSTPKVEVSVPVTATPVPAVPATPVAKAVTKTGRAGAFFIGALVGCLVGMWIMKPNSKTVSASPAVVASVPAMASQPNLVGRGWMVVNKTGKVVQAIDGQGNEVATILPGHIHPFSVMSGPAIYLRFRCEGKEIGKPISYVFKDGESGWREYVLQ